MQAHKRPKAHRWHLDVNVDAIEQRTGNAHPIVLLQLLRQATGRCGLNRSKIRPFRHSVLRHEQAVGSERLD